MDPYLEHPDPWPECHNRLIVAIADALVPVIRPKYEVAIEKRIYQVERTIGDSGNGGNSGLLVGIPDMVVKQSTQVQGKRSVPGATSTATTLGQPQGQPIAVAVPLLEQVKQSYLEVRELSTGRVVTAIEVLSPVNKRPGNGRNDYLKKRQTILHSTTHLVEIDLLRGFMAMPLAGEAIASAYRVLVSRGDRRPQASLYAFNLSDPIPTVPLPLLPGDPEPHLELQVLVNQVYDRGGFDYRLNYQLKPSPPLSEVDQAWVQQILPLDSS
jgi:hypothetical protein